MAKSLAGSTLLLCASGAQGFAQQPQVHASAREVVAGEETAKSIRGDAGLTSAIAPDLHAGETSAIVGFSAGCTALLAASLVRRPRAATQASRQSVVCHAYDASRELGACDPLGYWDPFNFMEGQDKDRFDRHRELELKHGRVCMAATIGVFVPDLIGKFPGYLSPSQDLKFADIPSSIQAIYKVPVEGWLQIFAFAGLIEIFNLQSPKNYGYPPFTPGAQVLPDGPGKDRKLLSEINNGRLAMMAMAAIVWQNGLTGVTVVEQLTGKVSAVSDFSQALPWASVPENLTNKPTGTAYIGDVGFDPAGFAQNKRLLPWYREAELAHGRVCMLATLGFTVQSAGGKWEPFITRFPTSSDDPLLAATQVPFVGWFQIIAVIGLSELWRYENVISKYDEGVKPGDLGWNVKAPVDGPRPKWFGPTFTAGYSKQDFELMQLREIKHGRLAMFGFFFMVLENANGVKNVGLIPNFELPEYAAAVGDFIPKNL